MLPLTQSILFRPKEAKKKQVGAGISRINKLDAAGCRDIGTRIRKKAARQEVNPAHLVILFLM